MKGASCPVTQQRIALHDKCKGIRTFQRHEIWLCKATAARSLMPRYVHGACYSPPMRHLLGLNDRQKEAVLHTDGPLLIVAGAGAGKTKTITHRIAHLIESGIPSHRILAVTFTNKAAGEMRERVRSLLPEGRAMPLMTTFHSLGVRLLREFHQDAGLSRGFTIWDRDDSLRAVKTEVERRGFDNWPPRAFLATISREKGDGVSPEEYAQRARTFRERAVAQIWPAYEKALRDESALDFDDLLFRTLRLLKNSERVRSLLTNRWSHLTIDEYQDTNRAQYDIARLLAGEKRNICVVGDTDQNIYSWRGADIEHLLGFEQSFPGAKVVLLEQNYRSTSTILAAANSVIEKNVRRRPKRLFTDKEVGEAIVLYGARNEIDEAWFVASQALELIERDTPAGAIAVLYRENFQSRAIEEAMLHLSVPYRVLGTRFFERKEVKDTLSYLRAAMNPHSRADISRIVAVPSRGIGKVTLDKMLEGRDSELPSAARTKVAAFRETLARIKHAIDTLPASETVRYAVEASGMEKMYRERDDREERIGNIQELINVSTKYDGAPPPEGIEKLLEEAALQSDQDDLPAGIGAQQGLAEEKPAVSLMTVHASKGLEFDAVFISGMEQGLFPSTREDEKRDPEEDRRLFYVALTRAKKRLFLSYALERMKYGSREYTIPSEFLDDIDARLIEGVKPRSSLLDDIDTIR
jgi:DNA helicase II / ATP-dependent DNA helicase PcrA